jgi:hypothetical protein
MDKFWLDYFSQTLAGLTVVAIVGIFGYVFRKWVKVAFENAVVAVKWWARQWKFNLAALLVLLLEFVVYFFFRSLLAIILSLVHIMLVAFVYRLFDSKTPVNPSLFMNQSADWLDLLISCHWVLVFRPPDQFKPISFLSDGKVGDGQNQNEHTWRIRNGKLELLQEDGHVHSRFKFDKKTMRFTHTNELDTLSVRSQIIRLA